MMAPSRQVSGSHPAPQGTPLRWRALLMMGLLLPTLGLTAEDSPGTAAGTWEQTRDMAADWWRDSRDLAGRAMRDAKGLMGEQEDFAKVWEQAVPTLEDALKLEDRQGTLPETAWLGEDQRSNRAEIDALLDEAVGILTASPALKYREHIQGLQEEIQASRAAIADYRQRRIAAPRESAVKKTAEDYDELIAAREKDIAEAERKIAALKRQLGQELRGLGLEVSDEQLELLLSTVVGDNMVDLGVVFDNVKAITIQLGALVEQSGEDLQSARRYYGLYVVLLKSLSRMHAQIEGAIGERYLPQIDDIIGQAQQLAEETQRLMRESPDKRDLLSANLEAQQLTIQAAGVYRQYLQDQSQQVEKARRELDKDIAAAWNTYETVRVSGELVGLVRSSQQLLEGLMDREVPALRPFENLEMQREIEQLTRRLRTAEPR
jgi:hypothetical protein